MAALEEKYTKYLKDTGILPRLLEILEQLVNIDPLPAEPLLEILHGLGCPLIPPAQMKALERKVSRAQDELRYLRRVLIDLGGQDQLYDSDTDENEYVGQVSELGAEPFYSPHSSEEDCPTSDYILEGSVAVGKNRQQQPQHEDEQQPCCSRDLQVNAHRF